MKEGKSFVALELIQGFWKEVPKRRKDYIVNAKGEYRSLHAVIDIRDQGTSLIPLMEVQIRTTAMDMVAETSHSLYKGSLEDSEETQWLKETMLAAAEVTALHLKDLPSTNHRGNLEIDSKNPLFFFTDENGDGRISLEELTKVMEDFGAWGKDALELMQLLDANNDGFLISEEFDCCRNRLDS